MIFSPVMQKSFIEVQFPISKLSTESYKERKANYSQTLTGLGKWWGRKPLILVRATILGLLMPSSDNPRKDREIFLKILTMDEEGLWQRKKGKGSDIPYPLPKLSMNAQPLRFLDYLLQNTICIETEGLKIKVPILLRSHYIS